MTARRGPRRKTTIITGPMQGCGPPPEAPEAIDALGVGGTSAFDLPSPQETWWRTASDADVTSTLSRLATLRDTHVDGVLAEAWRRSRTPEATAWHPGYGITWDEVPRRIDHDRSGSWTDPDPENPWRSVAQQHAKQVVVRLAARGRGDGTVPDADMETFLTRLERDQYIRARTLRVRATRGMPFPAWARQDHGPSVQGNEITDSRGPHERAATRELTAACTDGRVGGGDLIRLAVMSAGAVARLPGVLPVFRSAMDASMAGDRAAWRETMRRPGILGVVVDDPAWWAACPPDLRTDAVRAAFARLPTRGPLFESPCPIAGRLMADAGHPHACGILPACIGLGTDGLLAADRGRVPGIEGESSWSWSAESDVPTEAWMRPADHAWRAALGARVAAMPPEERRAAAAGIGDHLAGIIGQMVDPPDGMPDAERNPGIASTCAWFLRHAHQMVVPWGDDAVAALRGPIAAAMEDAAVHPRADLRLLAALGTIDAASGDA